MLISKRGQLGGFTTLFWAIFVIFAIMLVFIFSFSLLKAFNQVEYGTKVIKVFGVGDYMDDFVAGVAGPCKSVCDRGETKVIKGDNAGICVCDSSPTSYSFSKDTRPFTEFFPPCEKSKFEGTSARSVDESLELTDTNRNENGVCVIYHSNRYYTELSTGKAKWISPNAATYEELSEYKKGNGYIEKIFSVSSDRGIFIKTREVCAGMSSKERLIEPVYFVYNAYPIFYTYNNALENVAEGHEFDMGYCVVFSVGGEIENSNGIVEALTTRDDCLRDYEFEQKKNSRTKVSFFMLTQFEETPFAESKIAYGYSPDYFGEVRGVDLMAEDVRGKCPSYSSYDLTFITGSAYYRDGKPRIRSDGTVRYAVVSTSSSAEGYARSACEKEIRSLGGEGYDYLDEYEKMTSDDVKLLDDGDSCCYLNRVEADDS